MTVLSRMHRYIYTVNQILLDLPNVCFGMLLVHDDVRHSKSSHVSENYCPKGYLRTHVYMHSLNRLSYLCMHIANSRVSAGIPSSCCMMSETECKVQN